MTLRSLPVVAIEISGAALRADVAGCLAHVRVQQRLSLPTVAELTFVDPPDRPLTWGMTAGAAIEIRIANQRRPLLTGEVSEVIATYGAGAERTVRVRAYDLLHRLRKRQAVKAWTDVGLRQTFEELATAVGLTADANGADGQWSQVFQSGQSDLEFLAELAQRSGWYLTSRERTVGLTTLEGVAGEPIVLALGTSLIEAEVHLSGEPACRSVRVGGWDPLSAEARHGAAAAARTGRDVTASAPPERFSIDGSRQVVGGVVLHDAHADGLAQSELDRRVAGEVVFSGVAEGDTELQPGTRVQVKGLDPDWDGRHVLTAVDHIVTRDRGFVSEVSTAPPGPARTGGPTSLPTFTLGVVADVDDPLALGRVKVKLTGLFDADTLWLAVLVPAAGPGKGIVALPDVDDLVLVALPDGNAAAGIVLGGLFGPAGPPDAGVVDGGRRRFTLTTAGGQLMCLDDSRDTVLLQDRRGNRVELTPHHVLIHAEVDLHLHAPGCAVVLTASSFDMRRG